MATCLGLPVMMPACGYIVVGGPESRPASHLPIFDLHEDLSPDLSLGGAQAAGIGLFATAVQGMSPTLLPIGEGTATLDDVRAGGGL